MTRSSVSLPASPELFWQPYSERAHDNFDQFALQPSRVMSDIELMGLTEPGSATPHVIDMAAGYGQTYNTSAATCVLSAARSADAVLAASNGELPRFPTGVSERQIVDFYKIHNVYNGKLGVSRSIGQRLLEMAGCSIRNAPKGPAPIYSLNRILGSRGIALVTCRVRGEPHVRLVGGAFRPQQSPASGILRRLKADNSEERPVYQVWDPAIAGARHSEDRYAGIDMSAEKMAEELDPSQQPIVLVGVWRAKRPEIRVAPSDRSDDAEQVHRVVVRRRHLPDVRLRPEEEATPRDVVRKRS